MLLDDPRIATGYASTNKISIQYFKKFNNDLVAFAFNNFTKEIGYYEGIKVLPNLDIDSKDESERLYGSKKQLLELCEWGKPDILFIHSFKKGFFNSLIEHRYWRDRTVPRQALPQGFSPLFLRHFSSMRQK